MVLRLVNSVVAKLYLDLTESLFRMTQARLPGVVCLGCKDCGFILGQLYRCDTNVELE
ncbi:MAG: hypothetical protein WAL67_02560 [Candidatus Cybelea sp.]